jgi:hypothetical protein
MPFGTTLEAVVTVLEDRTPLHLPDLHLFEEDGLSYAVDGAAPPVRSAIASAVRVNTVPASTTTSALAMNSNKAEVMPPRRGSGYR